MAAINPLDLISPASLPRTSAAPARSDGLRADKPLPDILHTGDPERVRRALAGGVDPNAVARELPPLEWAIEFHKDTPGHAESLRLLLAAARVVYDPPDLRDALTHAIAAHPDFPASLADPLIERFDLSRPCRPDGLTHLMFAADNGRPNAIERLLPHSDPLAIDSRNHCALRHCSALAPLQALLRHPAYSTAAGQLRVIATLEDWIAPPASTRGNVDQASDLLASQLRLGDDAISRGLIDFAVKMRRWAVIDRLLENARPEAFETLRDRATAAIMPAAARRSERLVLERAAAIGPADRVAASDPMASAEHATPFSGSQGAGAVSARRPKSL
jgi:hypothetical protein